MLVSVLLWAFWIYIVVLYTRVFLSGNPKLSFEF